MQLITLEWLIKEVLVKCSETKFYVMLLLCTAMLHVAKSLM